VRSPGRTALAVALPVLAVSLAAMSLASCTGGPQTPSSPATSVASPGGLVTSNAPAVFTPGEYRYTYDNILVSLSLHGSDGTLQIHNGSGAQIGPPGLYVITGDDHHVDGSVANAVAIPDGGDATLDVTFPPEVTAKTVGLMILLLGPDNMGALAPAVQG
jgi:hypothetical protein